KRCARPPGRGGRLPTHRTVPAAPQCDGSGGTGRRSPVRPVPAVPPVSAGEPASGPSGQNRPPGPWGLPKEAARHWMQSPRNRTARVQHQKPRLLLLCSVTSGAEMIPGCASRCPAAASPATAQTSCTPVCVGFILSVVLKVISIVADTENLVTDNSIGSMGSHHGSHFLAH